METILTEVARSCPSAVAVVVVVLIFQKIFNSQRDDCHEQHRNLAEDYKQVTKEAIDVMKQTNVCLTQCASSHERSEKIYRRFAESAGLNDEGSDDRKRG